MVNKVMVIGLGNMGSALAMALLKKDHEVTVWNRTASKAAPLVEAGASQAGSVAEGVGANGLIVICMGTYDDATLLLEDCGDLSGKTLIQLTNAYASEAKVMEAWVIQKGGLYLDGAIMGYPSDVGTEECELLAAGSQDAWRVSEPVVMCLGGSSRYLGENVSAPSSLNAALLFPYLATIIGMVQGVQIIEKEGMDVGEYVGMVADMFGADDGSELRRQGNAIARDAFGDTEAALETWAADISGMVEEHAQRGINVELPRVVCNLLNRAVEAGYGGEEVAAVIKVMREGTAPIT